MTKMYLFHRGVLLGFTGVLALATGCGDDGPGMTSSVGDASATETGGTDSDTTPASGSDDTTPSSGSDSGTTGDPTTCGDGVIEGDEQCEGDDLAGATCVDLGYTEGELACAADCTFDMSACTDGLCGDGMLGGSEACDIDDFGGATCADLGYDGGELACRDDCTVDESGCYSQVCGDEMISGLEECDGALLDDQTCETLGFYAGELLCSIDCAFDTAGCTNCGNEVIDAGELCESDDLGGETCQGLDPNYVGGTLACADTCDAFVEDDCAAEWWGDDFESGSLGAEWVLSGNADWFVSTSQPHNGSYVAESGNIADSQQTHMEVTVNFVQDGSVTFWRRVSSETDWDILRFYIDGALQGEWSGNLPWTMQMYNITAGQHMLRWTYYKDGSSSSNDDTVWVDEITTVGGLLP